MKTQIYIWNHLGNNYEEWNHLRKKETLVSLIISVCIILQPDLVPSTHLDDVCTSLEKCRMIFAGDLLLVLLMRCNGCSETIVEQLTTDIIIMT
jgi:hypothetical protein